ncbi:MAG: hypothetical protein EPO63_00950 [Candidatus Nitrosotenuis sp.]|nr:MAG: hypothetical protein EPO63_00950 [Candidatus Nitrosotenuis sp.]
MTNPKQEMSQIASKIMNEASPIKEILYEQINSISEQKIQVEISKNGTARLIRGMVDNCYPKIAKVYGNPHESFEAFAESLMHYLLTNALIQSQRKVTHGGIELDIVIPDVRTLVSSPKDAVIIFFPKTGDISAILESLRKIETIQPIKENIWLVQKTSLGLQYKTYEIDNGCSFSNIINDIDVFSSSKTQSKFKIFKV